MHALPPSPKRARHSVYLPESDPPNPERASTSEPITQNCEPVHMRSPLAQSTRVTASIQLESDPPNPERASTSEPITQNCEPVHAPGAST